MKEIIAILRQFDEIVATGNLEKYFLHLEMIIQMRCNQAFLVVNKIYFFTHRTSFHLSRIFSFLANQNKNRYHPMGNLFTGKLTFSSRKTHPGKELAREKAYRGKELTGKKNRPGKRTGREKAGRESSWPGNSGPGNIRPGKD